MDCDGCDCRKREAPSLEVTILIKANRYLPAMSWPISRAIVGKRRSRSSSVVEAEKLERAVASVGVARVPGLHQILDLFAPDVACQKTNRLVRVVSRGACLTHIISHVLRPATILFFPAVLSASPRTTVPTHWRLSCPATTATL